MYPKRKDLFDAWHKAMVAGATVDKPNYGKTSSKARPTAGKKHRSRRKSASRRRKKKNAQA